MSLTDITHRDKSLAGFVKSASRMKSLRDEIFRYAKGLKNQGIYLISNWSEATIYRVRAKREHIESTKLTYRQKKKREQEYKEKILIFMLSFYLYMGLGLAHSAFDRTNAMLALSGAFNFSAKNITHSNGIFYVG